jgi:hypothetical protein
MFDSHDPALLMQAAERVGFEPTDPLRSQHISSVLLSATQPPLHVIYSFLFLFSLRRGRDSNPRYRFRYSSFQDWSVQPLRHLSIDFLLQFSPSRVIARWDGKVDAFLPAEALAEVDIYSATLPRFWYEGRFVSAEGG